MLRGVIIFASLLYVTIKISIMVYCIIIYNGSTYEGGTFISYRRGLCVACLCRIGNAKASNRGTGNGTVPALFLRISNKDCLHVVTAPSAYRNEEIDVKATAKDKFNAVREKFSASYQEIQQNIYSALADANVYGYILENGNDYAIVSVFSDEDEREHLFRYEISRDENGFVTLGNRKEVRVEYVPVDEPKEEEQPEAKEEAKEEPIITEV